MKLCVLILISVFISTVTVLAQNNNKKIILVIESYHAGYAWDKSYKQGLREVLGDKFDLEFFEMDTKRIPNSEFKNRARLALDEYRKINPDLVILADDNALQYVGPGLAGTKTPVVYLGINNNPRKYKIVGHKNITGVLERPLLVSSISTIKKIIPELKKILILFDSGITSKASLSEIFRNKTSLRFSSDVQADMKMIGDLKIWKKTILSAKQNGYDAVIVGLYHTISENGKHVKASDIIEWTSENTPVPPFGFWEFSVGPDKTIGGFVLSGKEQGIAAAKIVLEIMSGKSPHSIYPVTGKKGALLFSTTQLKKWYLSLSEDIAGKTDYTK